MTGASISPIYADTWTRVLDLILSRTNRSEWVTARFGSYYCAPQISAYSRTMLRPR